MNDSVRYKIKYEVYPEDGMFVARCLDIDVASDGATDAEAVANLREAIELYFEHNAEALMHDADGNDSATDDEA
jgi:predicted RNase H-like HicB family nuclease